MLCCFFLSPCLFVHVSVPVSVHHIVTTNNPHQQQQTTRTSKQTHTHGDEARRWQKQTSQQQQLQQQEQQHYLKRQHTYNPYCAGHFPSNTTEWREEGVVSLLLLSSRCSGLSILPILLLSPAVINNLSLSISLYLLQRRVKLVSFFLLLLIIITLPPKLTTLSSLAIFLPSPTPTTPALQ